MYQLNSESAVFEVRNRWILYYTCQYIAHHFSCYDADRLILMHVYEKSKKRVPMQLQHLLIVFMHIHPFDAMGTLDPELSSAKLRKAIEQASCQLREGERQNVRRDEV